MRLFAIGVYFYAAILHPGVFGRVCTQVVFIPLIQSLCCGQTRCEYFLVGKLGKINTLAFKNFKFREETKDFVKFHNTNEYIYKMQNNILTKLRRIKQSVDYIVNLTNRLILYVISTFSYITLKIMHIP